MDDERKIQKLGIELENLRQIQSRKREIKRLQKQIKEVKDEINPINKIINKILGVKK